MKVSVATNGPRVAGLFQRARRFVYERRERYLRKQITEFGRVKQDLSPVATGRFKAASAQSMNSIGAGPFPVPQIQAPQDAKNIRFRQLVERVLLRDLRKWEQEKAEIESRGQTRSKATNRVNPWYRTVVRMATRARQYYNEWVSSQGTASVIAVFDFQKWAEAQRRKDQDPGMVLTRVYRKVYGGEGVMASGPTGTVATLKNKEPHARLVENTKAITKTAIRVSKSRLRSATNKHIRAVFAEAGLTTK